MPPSLKAALLTQSTSLTVFEAMDEAVRGALSSSRIPIASSGFLDNLAEAVAQEERQARQPGGRLAVFVFDIDSVTIGDNFAGQLGDTRNLEMIFINTGVLGNSLMFYLRTSCPVRHRVSVIESSDPTRIGARVFNSLRELQVV